MSRKHFELIAQTFADELASATDYIERLTVRRMATRMARELKATNPRFDTDRFLTACGLES